ncbi:MAG: hypothetical protein NXI27_30355 [Alphaproteobacteria bacterium]|nr:hypothetical protein [Alphaproteobacteria bacterium]
MVEMKAQFFSNTASATLESHIKSDEPLRPIHPPVNARTAAKSQRMTDSVETQISIKAHILKAVSNLKSSISALTGTEFKVTSTAPRIVSIGITDATSAATFSASITIRQLAAPQIIVFRLVQSAKPDTALRPTAGPVTLTAGQLAQSQQTGQTLVMDPDNNTIEALVQSLNGISGLKASLLQTKEGLAVLVKTRPATFNALQPESILALRRLLQPAFPLGSQPLVVSIGGVAAQDTIGDLNGRPFVYAATALETLVSGYRITAHALGEAKLQSEETIASLQMRVAALLREMNALIVFLTTAAQSGTGRVTAPSLADRMVAHVLLDRLRKIVSRPIHGFCPEPVLLTELGIKIDASGLLTLNEDRFTWVAKHRRDMVAAILRPAAGQEGSQPTQEGNEPDLLAGAVHCLSYDPTHSPVTATLNGIPLDTAQDASGRPVLTLRTQTQELSIVLNADEPISADVIYGQSLLDQVTDFATTVLDPTAPLMPEYLASYDMPQADAPEAAPADIMVAGMFLRPITQGDATHTNALATLPSHAIEIVVYLLWIGLFIPDITQNRRNKRRTQTPRGWRRKRVYTN